MIVLWLPAVVCIVGAVLYYLPLKSEVRELGRLAFFCGLLVWLMHGGR